MRSVREAVDLTGSERWFAVPVFALVTGTAAIFAADLPPPGLKEPSAEISAPVFFIYATPGQGGESLQPDALRGCEPAQADLGRKGRPHRCRFRAARGVRTASGRVLRPGSWSASDHQNGGEKHGQCAATELGGGQGARQPL